MWGEVMCAAALELSEAHDLLKELEVISVGQSQPNWSGSSIDRSRWVTGSDT